MSVRVVWQVRKSESAKAVSPRIWSFRYNFCVQMAIPISTKFGQVCMSISCSRIAMNSAIMRNRPVPCRILYQPCAEVSTVCAQMSIEMALTDINRRDWALRAVWVVVHEFRRYVVLPVLDVTAGTWKASLKQVIGLLRWPGGACR